MITSRLFVLLLASFFLAACQAQTPGDSVTPSNNSVSSLSELSGTFTLTDPATGKGILKTSTGDVAVESLVVDLATLDGAKVTLSGKFSGDTLFVSAVQ